ncbi:unnamed protein product [Ectocarpus fasciculatus]
MKQKLADATNIDMAPTVMGRLRASGIPTGPQVVSAETAARREREQNQKGVKLMVKRTKQQQHVFHTRLGTKVSVVEEKCREDPDLVSREEEEDAEVALFYKDKQLESDKTLRESGIPPGRVDLRLDVKGGSGGGGGASGAPITLKLRVDGGKTFMVTTTTGTKFSAFMEGFNEKVGIPPERASECVFKFEGGKLNPDGTPEVRSRRYHSGGGGSGNSGVSGRASAVTIGVGPRADEAFHVPLFSWQHGSLMFVPVSRYSVRYHRVSFS